MVRHAENTADRMSGSEMPSSSIMPGSTSLIALNMPYPSLLTA